MANETNVRPARASDTEQLSRIGFSAWKKGIGPYVPAIAHAAKDEQTFATFARVHYERILIAEIGGEVCGFVGRESWQNVITDLWVDPAVEGRGVGSALMQAAEKVIADLGYSSVFIEALTDNSRAFRLYRWLEYEINWQDYRRDSVLGVRLHKTGFSKTLG